MWKKKETRVIFTHPRITLIEDTVRLTDGTETDYVSIEGSAQSVGAIIRNGEGKLLILQEYTWPNDTRIWNFPGGMVNEHESLEDALRREAKEEAGCEIVNLKEIGIMYPYHRRSCEQLHIFTADLAGMAEQELEAEEEITLHWKTASEITKLLNDEKVNNAHTLATWSLYLLHS
ncbi:MAG: RNA pyrophosphohydrolase [candidate division WS6 bacterium OLB20]|uniref:RNA pyrophosphohydrolase n=1 Tax=candidate division WS6 bacterium OLB20 TaxID=1617426 RepID=A0A136LVT3_9BACT|nr:MAG: RNA pyrophosphohydrolase [candidate division WS6 bacterium OLB20]